MTEINAKLFKKYDIRGKASGNDAVLTPEVAKLIGRGFATYLQSVEMRQNVVVGRDNRASSPELTAALIEGLRFGGCHVVDIGLVATPLVYWHATKRDDSGGVMVTGSHLAGDQNGFKLSVGSRPVYGDQLQLIRKLIEGDRFFTGGGNLEVDETAYSAYTDDLAWRVQKGKSLKVVIDAGNGMGGLFAPTLFEKWGHEVVAKLYCDPDPTFPNHHPNPQEEVNMRDLAAKVREVGADVGIAFDGDSDRMGAVDEKGNIIPADRLLALLAVDMLKRHPGSAVVADVLCSQVLFDTVRNAGGYAFMAASGHSLVKEEMRNKSALLGGEMSGHIFLGEEYYGFDDGFLAAGRLLQVLAHSDKTLSQLDAELPRLFATPEYRPHCPDDQKETVINGVADLLKDKGYADMVDGFRLTLPNGWGILRASNTEPVLSLRFEGQTEADAQAIQKLFTDALKQYPQVDRSVFKKDSVG